MRGRWGHDDQGRSDQRGAAPHGETREPVEEQRHRGCRRGPWLGPMGVAKERRQILGGMVAQKVTATAVHGMPARVHAVVTRRFRVTTPAIFTVAARKPRSPMRMSPDASTTPKTRALTMPVSVGAYQP